MTPTQKLERIVKAVMALVLLVPSMLLLTSTLGAFWDPTSPLRHFRETPVLPHVLAKGTLRSAAPAITPIVPPLCEVRWQRWTSCGRNPCWVTLAELKVAEGSLDVAWSSSPTPKNLTLSNAWNAEPGLDANVVTDPQRGATWLARAKLRSVDLRRVTEESGKDRLLERCVDDGAPLYVEGCVVGNELGPCPGRNDFSLVPSASPRPAIVAAADVLALKVGGELLLLIPAALLLIPPRGALVNALSARGGRKPGGVGVAWWLLVLPFGAGVWNLVTDAKHGGLILLFAAALAWALITKHLLARRSLVEGALAPILSIVRSPLTRASGTVELLVRAKLVGHGAPRLLGPKRAAYVETKVVEHYGVGKTKQRTEPVTLLLNRELHVVDESGEGVLDLEHSILDVKVEELTCNELPPSLAAHGFRLPQREHHAYWTIEERAIEEGETLFVIGEVSEISLRPDGVGYRSVRGSPKIGGVGEPPVVVFSGDERGILAALRGEGRFAQGLAIVCATVATSLVGFAGFLARL